MSNLTAIGLVLSLLTFLLLVYLLYDCFTRPDQQVPSLPFRDEESATRIVRWAMALVLLAGFAAGVLGYPVIHSSESRYSRTGSSPVLKPAREIETTIRLPFWVRRTTRLHGPDGQRLGTTTERQLQIPWIFFLTVGLYWATMMNADSEVA